MRRLLWLSVACALLVAACAGQDAAAPQSPEAADGTGAEATDPDPREDDPATEPDEPVATEPEEPEATEPEVVATTPDAIDFEAALVSGGTFRGSDYDGRDVALWFWAPW